MRGLVAVNVAANYTVTGDVLSGRKKGVRQMHCEELVEIFRELCLTTHHQCESIGIVRNEETIIPRVPLNETLSLGFLSVEVRQEFARRVLWPHEANGRVPDVAPVVGAFDELVVNRGATQLFGGLGYRPIVVCVLECL